MSDTTAISWTEATWNPWTGCTRVSEGCDHCYMMTLKKRWGANPEIVVRSKTTFRDPLKWKEPRVIFTCSMSDFFHVDADPWREEAWEIIRNTPQHTYQILTKRPGRIARHLPADWGEGYPNVWLGTSVEGQSKAFRIRQLLKNPAAIHFVSAEPLLASLHLVGTFDVPGIDWVIIGGESGPGFRNMEIGWLADLVAQCQQADVKVWVKQDSGPRNEMRGRIPDHLWIQEMPAVRDSDGSPKGNRP
jgi:protein gp37